MTRIAEQIDEAIARWRLMLSKRGEPADDMDEAMVARRRFSVFNVNEQVRVRLTERGRRILRDHDEEWGPPVRRHRPDKENRYTFQLHEAMNIFGPHFVMGLDPPFEGCSMEILWPEDR